MVTLRPPDGCGDLEKSKESTVSALNIVPTGQTGVVSVVVLFAQCHCGGLPGVPGSVAFPSRPGRLKQPSAEYSMRGHGPAPGNNNIQTSIADRPAGRLLVHRSRFILHISNYLKSPTTNYTLEKKQGVVVDEAGLPRDTTTPMRGWSVD